PDGGIAGSLAAGVQALDSAVSAAFVCLGDMPQVGGTELRRLAAAFAAATADAVCVPTYDGRRGNPVLWGRAHFRELAALTGDVGGRTLFPALGDRVLEVPVENPGVLLDVDTPAAWRALQEQADRVQPL
ncbi:MAG: nucleotidyltransferase family protein, partial [Longimicrobiaceae bacterium]